MPNAEGFWTKDEVDAHVTAVVKERVDRLNNSHKLQSDALREQLTAARETAAKHEAAAQKYTEMTAAQAKQERDAAWSALGIGERARLRALLESEYDALAPADGAERPTFAAWIAEQREIPGSSVADLLPAAPVSPATPQAPAAPARPPAATTPAAPAVPAATDPAKAFEAKRASTLAAMKTMTPAERAKAQADLVAEAQQVAAGRTVG